MARRKNNTMKAPTVRPKIPKNDREMYVTQTLKLPDGSKLTIDDYNLTNSSTNRKFFDNYVITDELIGWGGHGAVFKGNENIILLKLKFMSKTF